jgi:hypothetical protein
MQLRRIQGINGVPSNNYRYNSSHVAMVSLPAYMYKWEQQHLLAENQIEDYIHTYRKAAYTETHLRDLDEIPRNQLNKLAHTLIVL